MKTIGTGFLRALASGMMLLATALNMLSYDEEEDEVFVFHEKD